MSNSKLLEVSMMLGDAIKKFDALSAYKPPKTKTLYKWAFRHSGKWWKETECFYATKEDAANSAAGLDALGRNEIVRMDATAIEVDA